MRRPDRFLLIGALLSLAVAIAAPLALFSSNAPSTHAAVAGQQPELDVTGSLLAYDGVAEKRWATDITAALTDPLSFHLTLRNHSSTATPLLDVEPFYVEPSDPDGLPWTVWVAIGPPDSETTLPGAYAQITPQENGLGFINFDPSSFRAQRLGQTGSVQLYAAPSARSDFQSPTGQVRASTAAVLGSLAPHETQLVTFTAQSSGSDGHILPDPYAGGSVIGFRTSPTSQFHQFGAASSGETLLFRIMVDTPDGTPLAPVLRVAVSPHDAQHSVSLTAFASVPYGPPQKLAAAVVSAAGTSMISLSPVPGSTRLRGYHGDTCTHIEDLGALPDGITEGGIEIGQVGGFHPRDPCKGDEFIRWVQFTMHVGGAE